MWFWEMLLLTRPASRHCTVMVDAEAGHQRKHCLIAQTEERQLAAALPKSLVYSFQRTSWFSFWGIVPN